MKGIIFNTQEVQAVLEGRKTRHTILINPQPVFNNFLGWRVSSTCKKNEGKAIFTSNDENYECYIKPPYQVGQILYVKETWQVINHGSRGTFSDKDKLEYYYKADQKCNGIVREECSAKEIEWNKTCEMCEHMSGLIWQPSTRMPKEAARFFLKVTSVRVARLQDIECEEAIEEGIKPVYTEYENCNGLLLGSEFKIDEEATIKSYILGKQIALKISKDENPWQWVIEFERIEKPKEEQK